MDIECLKTKRHFTDLASLIQCGKEHSGCSNCPFKELNHEQEQTDIDSLKENTRQPIPEVVWPITAFTPKKPLVPPKKGLFGKLSRNGKDNASHKVTRVCPRCGGTRFEYQGDKRDWVSVTAKYRCIKCGKQFD
jgi:predicted  nucleic acid-binding Zn-ribbon protein